MIHQIVEAASIKAVVTVGVNAPLTSGKEIGITNASEEFCEGNKLLKEVVSDEQLVALLSIPGFSVNVDYPRRDVKLHTIRCKCCDPRRRIGVKPSSKILNKTGEVWFSSNYREAASKATEIAETRGYKYKLCRLCNP